MKPSAAVLLLLPLQLSGYASYPLACVPPAQPAVAAEMLFGRKIGNRLAVTESDFAAFLAEEVTPRFPEGLTVIDARGQWRDARRTIVHEPSKLLRIVFFDDAQKRAAVAGIAEAYKKRFSQDSVLTTFQTSCAVF